MMIRRHLRPNRPATACVLSVAVLVAAGCQTAEHSDRSTTVTAASEAIGAPEYAARRHQLMDKIPDGVAVIPGATPVGANYPFRQNNDFCYLTGVEVPDAFLVVNGVTRQSVLFLDLSEHQAREAGLPLQLANDPCAATGIERVRPVAELAEELEELSARVSNFYAPFRPQELPRVNSNEQHAAWGRSVTTSPWDGRLTRELQFVTRLRERHPSVVVKDCSSLVWSLRKVKSPAEIALMRRAAQIAVAGHLELMRSTAPGVAEQELAALFEFVCRRAGAEDLAYYTILMSGPNHPYGHYHKLDRVLADGDFVILDAGPDYHYYDADVSTSFPANGVFSPDQRALYELAEGIHQVCLRSYRPGITLRDVGQKIAAHLTDSGYDVAEPRFRSLATWGGYNHPIGMATHDVMATITGPDEVLRPGFVFACDINMPHDDRMGIRIEDTVVITEDGCEVLSAGLPRSVAAIEALMTQRGVLQRLSQQGPEQR